MKAVDSARANAKALHSKREELIYWISKKPSIERFFKVRRIKKQVQALDEAGRDIQSTTITEAQSTAGVVNENNYPTYSKQVFGAYDMYDNRSTYGGEYLGGIVDIRVAFIGGDGISIQTGKKATSKYVDKLLESTKLHGSLFFRVLETMELEGRCLLQLKPDRSKKNISVSILRWVDSAYSVEKENGKVKRIRLGEDDAGNPIFANMNRTVYFETGGSGRLDNWTTNRIHRVLTDIENASRSKYDLRTNGHLFGRPTPSFEVQTPQEAKSINQDINAGNFKPGSSYAGTGRHYYAEPSGGAADLLSEDQKAAFRAISMTTGIPFHMLAYPELLSNRATAEVMMEAVEAATKKERIICQEAIRELIDKSMDLAIDSGFESNSIKGDYQVHISNTTATQLKALGELYIMLEAAGVISMGTVRNRIPFIDPIKEKKAIEEEHGTQPDFPDNRNLDDLDQQAREIDGR